ncbi:radical SAM protein [Anaerosphaera multitolerans]|uniref:Radical SAM protein n=1 Tax=Anaerosphaera multitolerans TaxID=2487351 RepID=A0A437S9J6_9FIRM|nr:radical SAM protein [Anaerosphaera multitolerans]RVU55514.1 radical SAM protein [Anaerosphaera multitolerans]
MERYSIIKEKFPREIVLLKAKPCSWGKCTFCDYILDNSTDEEEINALNDEVLKRVTGIYKRLEVIDSASVFELTEHTMETIREVVREKGIEELVFEAHYLYKNRLEEIRNYFKVPVFFKTGIETFDNDFRNKVLKKGAVFNDYSDVEKYFDSPCIMVGIKGQTREMIDRDMDIVQKHFKRATVNIFINNGTEIKRDEELVKWFSEKYYYLKDDPRIEILFENTDFGVG